MKKARFINIILPVLVFLLILNILIGTSLISRVWANQDVIILSKDESIKLFSEVYSIIKNNYIEEIETPAITESAILGIVSELDPHSNYLDEDKYKSLMEDQQEEYGGLGIMIGKRDGFLTVIAPLELSPAHKLGIRAGDIIVDIEGSSTQDMDINSAVKLLKGPPGTSVSIKVRKKGIDDIFEYKIERDIIKIKSVPYYFLLKNNKEVGYVKINNFAQATAEELNQAIKALLEKGAKYLLLDLRSNPGGLLDQAAAVTETFLHENLLIVYTKGRTSDANQEYFSGSETEHFEDLPLIVLVNEGSASGSEIVAGAIQDYDRGLILGNQTFGKGLVQTLFPLKDGNTALALTTAKYFTPSGRVIQKPFERKQGIFKYEDGTPYGFLFQKEMSNDSTPETITTRGGRTIRSDGGIFPDITVDLDEASPIAVKLEINGLYFKYSIHYINSHKNLKKDFIVDDKIIDDFIGFVTDQENSSFFSKEEFFKDIDNQKIYIKREILTSAFEINDGNEFIINNDRQVIEALKYLDKSSEILALYKKNLIQQ